MKKRYWIMIIAVILAVALIVALAVRGSLKTDNTVGDEGGSSQSSDFDQLADSITDNVEIAAGDIAGIIGIKP